MSHKYESLHDLLLLKLHSLYDIETQLVSALPKMSKGASDQALAQAFEQHVGETEQHVKRLENALSLLGEKRRKDKVEAIRGLVKDASWILKTIKNDAARDASLLAAGQYVEHYEIGGYGAAREWAELMGHDEVERLLRETLGEEKIADATLTELAKNGINQRANTGMTPMEKLSK